MKRLIFFVFVINLLVIPISFASPPVQVKKEQEKAVNFIHEYLNALFSGNTFKIKSMLGENLLSKRQRLLSNPTYSSFLNNTYNDAKYKILRCTSLRDTKVVIDVKIIRDQQETQIIRFVLFNSIPQLRIYSQTELTKFRLK